MTATLWRRRPPGFTRIGRCAAPRADLRCGSRREDWWVMSGETAARPRRRGWARALVVVASVLAFAAILAVWANRQVLNTDNWTNTSTELLENRAIRDQIGVFIVDQLYANVDVSAELSAALPERLQPLAGPAAGGLRQLAEQASKEALSRPRAQQAWADANRNAQLALLN